MVNSIVGLSDDAKSVVFSSSKNMFFVSVEDMFDLISGNLDFIEGKVFKGQMLIEKLSRYVGINFRGGEFGMGVRPQATGDVQQNRVKKGSIALWVTEKTSATYPDLTGNLNIGDKKYQVAVWLHGYRIVNIFPDGVTTIVASEK